MVSTQRPTSRNAHDQERRVVASVTRSMMTMSSRSTAGIAAATASDRREASLPWKAGLRTARQATNAMADPTMTASRRLSRSPPMRRARASSTTAMRISG